MINLKSLHSFGFEHQAQQLLEYANVQQLLGAATKDRIFDQAHVIIGGGTNTIFVADFAGSIIRLNNQHIQIEQTHDSYLIEADAGVEWHQLVKWTLEQGYYGLENLALIPGTVGAAPIQNIGAYGVEFADVCDFVEVLDKASLTLKRFTKVELNLGYRDSIFKQQLKGRTVVTKVGFKLAKEWRPVNGYAGLNDLTEPQAIFDQVVAVRQSKLPCHLQIPNAGSFFKNPVIAKAHFEQLQSVHTDVPHYIVDGERVKIPAAWLIEQCQLKGRAVGGVRVYPKHALVLTNFAQGNGEQLLALVKLIQTAVKQKYDISLVLEVQLIGIPANE